MGQLLKLYYQMTEFEIKERLAESGKTTKKELRNYLKRFDGRYDKKLGKKCIDEIYNSIRK